MRLGSDEALLSHTDWHFAKDLQDEDREVPVRPSPTISNQKAAPGSNKKKATGRGKSEKGQTKLSFG